MTVWSLNNFYTQSLNPYWNGFNSHLFLPSFSSIPSSIFNFGTPRYDVFNSNILGYTPPTNFSYIPQLNNPFSYMGSLNFTPQFTTPQFYTSGLRTGSNYTTNNMFGFLTTMRAPSSTSSRTPIIPTATPTATATSASAPIRTRKVGNRVAQEVLPGKEVLTIGSGIKLGLLKNDLKVKLVQLSEKANSLGYTLVVSDAFRTHEQQIDAKRRKPQWAATPGKSPHEYGAGIDIALYDKNGKNVNIANVDGFGSYARSIGLEWGNDWKSKKEPWHFQLANWRTRSDIAAAYRQRNNIATA